MSQNICFGKAKYLVKRKCVKIQRGVSQWKSRQLEGRQFKSDEMKIKLFESEKISDIDDFHVAKGFGIDS